MEWLDPSLRLLWRLEGLDSDAKKGEGGRFCLPGLPGRLGVPGRLSGDVLEPFLPRSLLFGRPRRCGVLGREDRLPLLPGREPAPPRLAGRDSGRCPSRYLALAT